MSTLSSRVATIALVHLDAANVTTIRDTLGDAAILPERPSGLEDGLELVLRTLPDAIIVGADTRVEMVISFAEAVLADRPDAQLIAVSRSAQPQTILSVLRAGFSEFLVLPQDAERLFTAATAHVEDDTDGEAGLLVSVLGAKGGVGTTLLATHLAMELSALHRVLCIDADASGGDVAASLNLQPDDTLHDLLARGNKIDERSLMGTTAHHHSKVHVLAQPEELEVLPESATAMHYVLKAAVRSYQYVFVDCGAAIGPEIRTTLELSDRILLVATPDVIGIRGAYRRLRRLRSFGIEDDRILLVLNKVGADRSLTLPIIEDNLLKQVSAELPRDTPLALRAMNEGRSLSDFKRSAALTQAIARLAGSLHHAQPAEPAPQQRPQGLLGRLLGRR